MMTANRASDTAEREIVISRTLDAPRDLVFNAFTDPEQVVRWWGPNGFTTTTEHMDVRPGGSWKFVMHGPDGTDYPNFIAYEEVVRPERLVYGHGADAAGDAHFKQTITFTEQGGKTEVTLHLLFPTKQARDLVVEKHYAIEGGKQTLARLDDYLENRFSLTRTSDTELVITRRFHAPRSLVFQAFTTPEAMKQWWGPRKYTMEVKEMDFRVGGKWEYTHADADGNEFGFRGEYREIVPPERLVSTFEFLGAPGQVSMDSYVLTEQDGWTTLTSKSVFPSKEGLDAMVDSGMEWGVREAYQRLAELLTTMA